MTEIKTINDLMPNSHDWNAERLAQLKAIMPDLFNLEGQLNMDELKKLINPALVNETERYEFRWFGKSNAKRNAFSPSNATLNFDAARSVNPQNAQNLIIEGDNLEVLKLLSTAYREQVKMIYIDPPYNTGKDFVYSDNFTQDKTAYWQDAKVLENGVKVDTNSESDGRYHSNWLNMMFSRLLIAQKLLRDNGVIFISIDDNEAANLKKLCDEVFGAGNFLGQFLRLTKKGGKSSDVVSKNNDFVFCYSKTDKPELFRFEHNDKDFKHSDEFVETRGFYKLNQTLDYDTLGYVHSLDYEVVIDGESYHPGSVNKDEFLKRKEDKPKDGYRWRWSRELFDFGYKNGFIVVKRSKNGARIYTKTYQLATIEDDGNYYIEYEERTKALSSIDFLDNAYSNDNAKKDVKKLLGKAIFDYPKPSSLVAKLAKFTTRNNDIILDFFAGSGTTAQAVMELNLEDSGNRQYICVQLPEATDEKSEAYKAGYKKISDITIARAAKVIAKLKAQFQTDKPEQMNALGFKVFKLTKSHFPRVAFAPDVAKTGAENIVLLQQYIKQKEAQLTTLFNADALMTEILLKNGFNLNYTLTNYPLAPQAQLTQNKLTLAEDGNKTALVCLDDALHSDTVAYFRDNIAHKFICLERALDTTKKYNLKHSMGDQFIAF